MDRSQLFRACSAVAAVLLPFVSRADPLHPIAHDAYWHHDSGFIFPAALAGFTRVGAPQERDGSPAVVAYYASDTGPGRLVVELDLEPRPTGPIVSDRPTAAVTRSIERAGWRLVLRAPALDAATPDRVAALAAALPVDRLGTIDTRCPNAGCGD